MRTVDDFLLSPEELFCVYVSPGELGEQGGTGKKREKGIRANTRTVWTLRAAGKMQNGGRADKGGGRPVRKKKKMIMMMLLLGVPVRKTASISLMNRAAFVRCVFLGGLLARSVF